MSIVGFSVWPHLFMKCFTARDDATIRRTVVLYPTFQIFLVPLFLIGFAGVFFASAPAEPDQILPHMLMNMEIPALLVGLFCAGGLAASMSSGDAMAHAAASIAVRDGWVRCLGRTLDAERERRWIQWGVVAVMVAAYAVAMLYRGSLVQLLLWAYGPVVQFAPAVVAALYWPRANGPGGLLRDAGRRRDHHAVRGSPRSATVSDPRRCIRPGREPDRFVRDGAGRPVGPHRPGP